MTNDVRMGDLVATEAPPASVDPGRKRIDIIGFPVDEGVRRNGGRPGARRGPSVFRERLRRFGCVPNPESGIDVSRHVSIFDRGDAGSGAGADPSTMTLEEAHGDLERSVTESLRAGAIPFVVGGGNDQSYPNARALLAVNPSQPVGVINIDAHLDVRENVGAGAHSGSPFRLMCEDPRFRGTGSKFAEFACQGEQCSAEHARWVEQRGHSVRWLGEVAEDPVAAFGEALDEVCRKGRRKVFVSFDIDSIDSAYCPGVSCPAPTGLTAADAKAIAFIAGSDPRVALMDVSEFNPDIEDYRTGRLLAMIFTSFAEGVAVRIDE